MTLKIDFDNSGGDIHIVIRDGCKVWLDKKDPRLSDGQRICSQQEGLRGYLYYEDIVIVENLHLEIDGGIKVYCPTCNTDYFITKEQYEKELEGFFNS